MARPQQTLIACLSLFGAAWLSAAEPEPVYRITFSTLRLMASRLEGVRYLPEPSGDSVELSFPRLRRGGPYPYYGPRLANDN